MKADWILSQEFMRAHPREAARVLESEAPQGVSGYLGKAAREAAAAVLQNMDPLSSAECLIRWTREQIADVLEVLPLANAARILRMMEPSARDRVLDGVPENVARALRSTLRYPEGTAAALMDPQVSAYPQDLRTGEVWRRLRRYRRDSAIYVYVVDLEGVLVGALSLRELMLADPREPLGSVMRRPVEWIPAYTRERAVLAHPAWRRFPDLPVVDEDHVLLGVIRYATLRQLELGDEATGQSGPWRVALALGELYWAGSSGLLRGLADTMTSASARVQKEKNRDGV